MALTMEHKAIAVVGAFTVGVAALAVFVGKRSKPRRQLAARRRKKEEIDLETGLPVRFHKQQRFEELLRVQDPDALLIAEDYALENGIKLTDDGYMVSRGPADSAGSFSLQPLQPADAPWSVIRWRADKRSGVDKHDDTWMTSYDVFWRDRQLQLLAPYLSKDFPTQKQAEKQAVTTAWWMAKQLKALPASTSVEDVREIIIDPPKKIPMTPGLLGLRRR